MAIKNESTINDREEINNLRSQMQQRAQWLYFIIDEMKKRGLDYESVCRDAIYRVGCFRGAQMIEDFADKGDLVELGECFRHSLNCIAFEKEFVCQNPEKLEMHFHHCPLVEGWRQVTDDEEFIAELCDIAMDGDRGIFSNIPDSEFILESTIAAGAPVCKLIVQKLKKDQSRT